jgi:hypothetical protein
MSPDISRDPELEQKRLDRVIIAAAVAAIFGRRATVRVISAAPSHREGAWIREGRIAIHASHSMAAPLIGSAPDRGSGKL